MLIKFLKDEDFVNYKKASMFIGFPNCTFKCGKTLCQNSPLAQKPNIEIPLKNIVKRYLDNDITKAIVCGGLEPLDDFEDVLLLIKEVREYVDDDIVIYTGYNEYEIESYIQQLKQFPNIIIKFGRYVINDKFHYDDVLGVKLASSNQYGKKIS